MHTVIVNAHTTRGGGGGQRKIDRIPQVGEEFEYGEPHEKWIVTNVERMTDSDGNEAVIDIKLEE